MLEYLSYYLIFMNILAFILCMLDKTAAMKHKWRISEKTLFSVSFFGGAFGFFIGMQLFRHKTKHLSFKILIPLFILLHIVVLILFYFQSI